MFIIADGIGGRKLEQATVRANSHVFDMSYAMVSAANVGCTMTSLVLAGGRWFLCHVGDSRCYLTTSRPPSGLSIFGGRQVPGPARSFITRASSPTWWPSSPSLSTSSTR